MALSVTTAYAGEGSGHPHGPVKAATEKQVIKNACDTVAAIVKKYKIDASWAEVNPTKAQKIKFKYGQEWIVSFNNRKVADQEKRTLYVFLSLDGQYLGANYSGN